VSTGLRGQSIGIGLGRLDGVPKVRGTALYAYEQPVPQPAYLYPVQATIARGTVVRIDTGAAEALDGVLIVLTHLNAPRLVDTKNQELLVLQSAAVGFRGQFIGAVVAESSEIARHAAGLVDVAYAPAPHNSAFSVGEHGYVSPGSAPGLPRQVSEAEIEATLAGEHGSVPPGSAPGLPRQVSEAEIRAALAAASTAVDQTYTTPPEFHVPMEPHTSVAIWNGRILTIYESTQGVHSFRAGLAPLFGLELDQVRVISPYVGGGFGSKLEVHAQAVLAAMAARELPGRAVKVTLTRQQMFSLSGYRPPTIQHVRLGADLDGTLTAVAVDVVEQSSRTKEFTEGSDGPARMMYAAPQRRTTNRPVALDVPIPTWMRAPGRCPGMFGLEVAMDELATACAVDPIALRVRNEPEVDPETGQPHAFRHLLHCLQLGARRFGWEHRDPAPRARLQHGWWSGMGVASATYPDWREPDNAARIRFEADGTYSVQIAAAEIGTGSRTVLTQIAAEALGCPAQCVRMEIGDSGLPRASNAGGSFGTISWGAAIVAAAETFRDQHGADPQPGAETEAHAPEVNDDDRSRHSFGAQFAEVRINADTGEIRVSRMLGVFSVGRVINPVTARSQFIGGMTMGIGMALHEHGVMDPRFGTIVNHDFADYHIPTCADIEDIDAIWLEEPGVPPGVLGARGLGEIGIVGAAAAIANAAYHATGVRARNLPLTPDALLS
jgi:xanthine dehydrogenase YagR molybdenum-binding subunit